MISGGPRLWLLWLPLWPGAVPPAQQRRPRGGGVWSRVACPHCTNVDTLSLHCADDRCGWVRCTCGALLHSSRRHRHPRHGSGSDTCHDPSAAV